MKRIDIKLGKKTQGHITKQFVHSFGVNIRISKPFEVIFTVLRLTNPDVNLKIMHQVYDFKSSTLCMEIYNTCRIKL